MKEKRVPYRAVRPRVATALALAMLAVAAACSKDTTKLVTPPETPFGPKESRMITPWTDQVTGDTTPLPEYPRPQLVRTRWLNLNGVWEFAVSQAVNFDAPPLGQPLAGKILVPFPVQSALSGVQRNDIGWMYYRRTFAVPADWAGQRVQLHFGAVTWEAAVWVNGTKVGAHTGSYDPFSFDVTSALKAGDNELVVGVFSPIEHQDGVPSGKQRENPSGIWYTPASGIWQTVWLEPTPAAHVTRLDTTPDVARGELDLVVKADGADGLEAEVTVLSNGATIATASGAVGAHLRIPIPDARLWSPDDPFLYDLQVKLPGADGDLATGYFGMRSIGKAMVGGFLRPVLNGHFVFQLGTLDQGFWPDGIYTAPTDEALRFDLEQQKALGFNTVRKHIKVEPARWFYWADKLGLLVWQDMPSAETNATAAGRANYEDELFRMVDRLRGITSIVQWIPFNEGWGEYEPARIADLVKGWDPTRLVDNMSGFNCCGWDGGNGDVIDNHIYTGPGQTTLPTDTRIAVLGEFGGWGLRVVGHEWMPGVGSSPYAMSPDFAALTAHYVETTELLQGLIRGRGLSASIYTQPTDVENELNGLWTYDRQVLKVNAAQARAANAGVLDALGALEKDRLVSLHVTSWHDFSLRHAGGLAATAELSRTSSDGDRLDATFRVREGLADATCWSFQSRNFPGAYLRVRDDLRVVLSDVEDTEAFRADATFCARPALGGEGWSFESRGHAGHFLRHRSSEVWADPADGTAPEGFAADAGWRVTDPWWRSEVNLPEGVAVGQRVSLRAAGSGRYLRHMAGVAYTYDVAEASDALLKADATFFVRAGLADPSCYSFQAVNTGNYLRHSAFHLRADGRGDENFDRDATFCLAAPRAGTDGVTLTAYNVAVHQVREVRGADRGEAWMANPAGPTAWDGGDGFDADATWLLAAPWAP